jgi:hypothetical protein
MKPRELAASLAHRLRGESRGLPAERRHAIWLYQPSHRSAGPLASIPGYRFADSWANVLRAVEAEQGGRQNLKVSVYPCAPLQCFETLYQTK